jgi:type VI secretion system secreted protein Hcp
VIKVKGFYEIFLKWSFKKMAIPAYLWLKDDGGADIKGSVDVHRREGGPLEVVR